MATVSVFTVFLVPEGRLKKQAETVISLVFLLLVVSLVADVDVSELAVLPEFDYYDIQPDSHSFLIDSSREYTENFISGCISDICTREFSVEAEFEYKDSTVILVAVTVYIDEEDVYRIPEIKSRVSELAGIIPRVIAE